MTSGNATRVGFIGLGEQGGPMAARVIAAGYPTTLWARRAASLEPYRATAASFAKSPAELGAKSDLVEICVVDDHDVDAVVSGEHGVLAGMRAGSVLALHPTISPQTCHRIAGLAGASGVTVVDAPVSGGGAKAAAGELVVMVGGDADAFERCRAVFGAFGDPVLHLGPLGAGLLAKLVNNTLHAAHYGLAHDAVEVGVALGLDRQALGRALSVGSGRSYSLEIYAAVGFETLAAAAGPLLAKDVAIFEAFVTERGIGSGSLVPAADTALTEMGHGRGPQA